MVLMPNKREPGRWELSQLNGQPVQVPVQVPVQLLVHVLEHALVTDAIQFTAFTAPTSPAATNPRLEDAYELRDKGKETSEKSARRAQYLIGNRFHGASAR